jgi:predicted ArsR family transcriptional regulator
MKKAKSNNPRSRQNDPTAAALKPEAPTRPGGKLGLIVQRLDRKAGATADELAEAAGWQKHSVLGALSRLRARGFVMCLETQGSRRAYRLARPKA